MLLPFRNVVLTGACGGFGQALARALIDGGARVALVGLDTERLAALAAQGEGRCMAGPSDTSGV